MSASADNLEERVAELLGHERELNGRRETLAEELASVDEQLGRVGETRLEMAELAAKALNGAAATAPKAKPGRRRRPGPKPGRPQRRRKAQTDAPKPSGGGHDREPKGESEATRDGRAEKARVLRQQIIDYVREHPGVTPAEIAEGLGIARPVLSNHLPGMLRGTPGGPKAALRAETAEKSGPGRRPKVYFPAESDVVPAKASGARTNLEVAVVKVIEDSPDGLYVEGIRHKLDYERKPSHDSIEKVCGGLVNRGVLQRATDNSYQLPS